MKNENGHGEHGPHSLHLGPDGLIYLAAGNGASLPQRLEPTSPHRGWADDLLIPSDNAFVPGGWIARTNETGETWELFAGGFRNPFDIAFNPEGELFTFDADSEADIGVPWYRPTRINHVVSAGEYGWRYDSPHTGDVEKYFFANRLTSGWCLLRCPSNGATLTLLFPPERLPYLAVVVDEGGSGSRFYALLEPCSAPFDRLDLSKKYTDESKVEAKSTRRWFLTFSLDG